MAQLFKVDRHLNDNDRMLNNSIVRRIAACLIAVAVLVPASPALADGDSHGRSARPVLLNSRLPAVVAGSSSWLNIAWVADGDIGDFRVVVEKPKGFEIAYSQTTRDHAGPMDGYAMSDKAVDFTAINLIVDDDYRKRDIKLKLVMTWTAEGKSMRRKASVKVPVIQHEGDDWEQIDTGGVLNKSSDSGWFDLRLAGLAPQSNNVRMVLSDDAGTSLYLPQGTWTGPHHDELLEAGETDTLRFWIDPDAVDKGEYNLRFTISWESRGEKKAKDVGYSVTID